MCHMGAFLKRDGDRAKMMRAYNALKNTPVR
jgi:hypothetical protein